MDELISSLKPLISALLLPPGILILLGLLGLILSRHRNRRLLSLGLVGCLLWWFSCCEASAILLERLLLPRFAVLSPISIDQLRTGTAEGTGAVLVLGGGVRNLTPERLQPDLKPVTLDRLRYGIWLSHRTGLPLAFSGGRGHEALPWAPTEAAVAARVAAEEFSTPVRWLEDRSRDTRENAAFTLPMLKSAGVRRIVLVTHAEHMARSLHAFRVLPELQGVEIIPAPIQLRSFTLSWHDWVPSAQGLERFRYVVYESLGRLAGR